MKVEFNLIDNEKLPVILPLLAELDSSIPFIKNSDEQHSNG
jgi:hypothetical protein